MKTKNTFENYPYWVLGKWQDITDVLAETIGISAALIMKAENEIMEVLMSSNSENNPYATGDKEKWHGCYCETVIKTQNKLLVPNASNDKAWDKNPDLKRGMIAYLGFPLNFPDNQPFGTLCVLDNKERHFTAQNEKLIRQFKNVIELDLALLQSFDVKTKQSGADVAEEITEHQQAKVSFLESIAELRQYELSVSLVRSSLEAVSDALYWMTSDSTIVKVNEAACRLLGYTREELLQLTVADVDAHYNAELWMPHFNELRKFGTLKFESEHRTKDGRLIPVEIVANYIRFGAEEYNCAFVRDITRRKAVEDALRESEVELENAERMAKVGNWIVIATNPSEPEKLFWSKEMYRIANRDPGSFTPTLAAQMDLFVPENARKLAEAVACSMKTGVPYDIELQLKDEEGRDAKWIRSHSEMVYDEKGRINGMRGTAQDITERKQAEEKLRLKNFIFDVSIAAKSIADINGIITEANDSFLRVWGFPDKNEVIGKPISFFIEDPDAANTIVTALDDSGKWEGDYIARKRDGSTFIAHGLATVVKDENGKIIAYQSAVIDITDSNLAANKLKASEQLYRNLFDQASEGLILLTMDGKIAELNQSFAQMHGYTVDEMKNMDIKDLDVLREGAFEGRALIMQRLHDGEVVRFDVDHYHKDGHIITFSDTVSIINIGGQNFFLAFHQDITKRKQVEEALMNSERNLKESQEIAGLGTFEFDILTGIFSTSQILNEIFGIDEEYDHSMNGWAALLHTDDREMVVNYLMNEVISNMQPADVEFRIVRYNDKITRWMHVFGKLEFDSDGHPVVLRGTTQDITERKQSEVEILELNRDLELRVKQRTSELETVNKELESFSYSVSHDLKAPLRHISGYMRLFREMKSKELTIEELGYLDVISSSASNMENLIDEILNFSRLNAIELKKKRICSSDLVQQVIKFFEPDVQDRIITFTMASLPDINGDEDLLRQVWINMISNAIKYTSKKPKAIIEIGSFSSGNEDTFFVKDNGAGFNMKYVEQLFGTFKRLHKVSDFEGIGIGLANVNRIITRHGGRCCAEGEVDKGATFYFSLPK